MPPPVSPSDGPWHPPSPMRKPAQRAAPDARSLHNAALTHLARFAATQAGLTRVLLRKVDRWARSAEGDRDAIDAAAGAARAAIAGIVARLTEAGAVSDAAFARSRARSLARAGRSRRAIGAQLAKAGVPGELAADATSQDEVGELAAALIHARKRRMGPWRTATAAPETARRELGSLARAGFAHGVAASALRLGRDEGELLIAAFRSEG